MKLEDFQALSEPTDPQISPDGNWVTYTLKTVDQKKDEHTSDVWMVSWDGKETLRLPVFGPRAPRNLQRPPEAARVRGTCGVGAAAPRPGSRARGGSRPTTSVVPGT